VGDARLVRVDWVSNTDLVERPYRYWSTGCTTNQRGAGEVHLPDHELSGRCRRPWAARVDTDGSAVVAATSRHEPSNRDSRSAASVSTPSRVATALRSAGVPRRSPWDRPNAAGPAISAGQLTDLYVNQGLTARQVAAELGCPLSQVAAALTRHRITRPVFPVTFDVDRATLTRLYVTEQLDDTVIAARYDVPPWRVTRRRRELDVHRPRIHRPPRPTPPAHLHGPSPGQSLPTAAVTATRHRSTPRTVRARPTRAGINTAPHARHGPPTPVGDDPALADLYTDPEVTGWRRRHQIPRRPHPAGGADTDPPATTLTRPLLRQAYQQIGLSVRQLAVLTGQPTNHVLHALAATGIPPPTDNDTSPWQARHRAQTDRHRRKPPR